MGGRTSGGPKASGRGDDGGEAPIRPHGGESGAPSRRLAEIRDTLLRRIEEQGEVPLHRPPARWPLTREHAMVLIERFAREGIVEIWRDGAGAVVRRREG